MGELVAIAQEQAGLAVEGVNGVGNAYTQGWKNLTQAQIDFYDQMVAAHMGYWQLLEDGTRQFVWATVAEMESMAEAAGTAAEKWENPYSWLYNYTEEINRLTREREKAERDYTKALEDETVTAEKLLEISQQQLSTLEAEAQMHATSAGRAMDEIQSQFSANSKFSKYVTYDAKTSEILIDYEKLEGAGFDEETGEEFEEFLSVIEENRDVILDAEEALYDIEDQIKEIKERGKEETSEMYNQIKKGLVQSRQKEIDEL
jgi:chromosome segregation ATPase